MLITLVRVRRVVFLGVAQLQAAAVDDNNDYDGDKLILLYFQFDPNTDIPTAMVAWGPEVFQPITLKLVTEEIPFPQFCYNCAT